MNSHAETKPTTTAFRSATLADVDAIVALVESAYRGEVSRQGWTTEAELLDGQRTDVEEITRLINGTGHRILLASRDGALVASAHLERQGNAAYFGMFSVRPDLQNAGLGRATLEEAERVARDDWACAEMHMTVIVQRAELIAWYQRRGYRSDGERKPWPYGDPKFGIPKRDDLEFEVLRKRLR